MINNYLKIFDNIDNAILVAESNGLVFYCNKLCGELLEKTTENLLNKHIGDILNLKILKNSLFEIDNLKKLAENNKFNIKLISKTKKIKHIEIKINVETIDSKDYVVFILKNKSQEIEDNNNIENNFKKLKEVNESLKKLLSIMAHDLRTPFSQVYSFLELLTDTPDELLLESANDILPMLKNSAKNGLLLIDSMVQWGKAISGKLIVKPTEFNICELITEVIASLKNEAKYKKIDILTFFEFENIIVVADRYMIKTVLSNLIYNAIKYSNFKSQIHIRAELYYLVCKIEITDFGVGLNKNQIDKLYDISQIEITNETNNEKCWGFGLLIAKEFIKLNNGNIWLTSIPNQKTSFYFTVLNKLELSKNQNNSKSIFN